MSCAAGAAGGGSALRFMAFKAASMLHEVLFRFCFSLSPSVLPLSPSSQRASAPQQPYDITGETAERRPPQIFSRSGVFVWQRQHAAPCRSSIIIEMCHWSNEPEVGTNIAERSSFFWSWYATS